jgi:hypothetical protein
MNWWPLPKKWTVLMSEIYQEQLRPTFLYVGASKAGSSWIYEVLREHPEVFVPPAKDIMFFDEHYGRGLDWYLSFFREGKNCKARGELSHNYFMDEIFIQRIHKDLPDVKIMCCLREVVDKMISEYVFNQNTGRGKGVSFEEFSKLPYFHRQYTYYENLKPIYELFPKENILVLFFDQLKEDPAGFVRRIYEFLEVDADFQPPSLLEKINAAHDPRLKWFAQAVYEVALVFRKLGMANLVGRVKRNPLMNKVLYRSRATKPVLSPEVREKVRSRYDRDYDRLEELLGRPLPPAWRGEPQR